MTPLADDDWPVQFLFPASAHQQRLWHVSLRERGAPVGNVALRVLLRGETRASALCDALQVLVDRHEILRTTFTVHDGEPAQVVSSWATMPVPLVDLGDRPAGEREAEAEQLADAEARRPFDLESGPLLRATLVRLAPGRHDLVLVAHEIVCDRPSLGVLVGELDALYAAFLRDRPSPLGELALQFADHAHQERCRLDGFEAARQLRYWRDRLAGAPAAAGLPYDRPPPAGPAAPSSAGGRRALALEPALVGAAEAAGRAAGCTPFATLLAAFAALLHRLSGQEDLLVGVPAGRRPEAAGLVGPFANALPLRADLSGRPTFRELLGRVGPALREADAHGELPLERLVAELRPERADRAMPLFRVALGMPAPPPPLRGDGLRGDVCELFGGCSLLDLGVDLVRRDGGLDAVATYRACRFGAATIAGLLAGYRALLASAVAEPDRPIAELPLAVLPD